MKQKTIAKAASFNGIGLHTGNLTTVTFKPAPADSGIVFCRVDLEEKPVVPALLNNVVDVSRGTTIGIGDVKIHTIEHAMACFAGLGIDNIIVEVDADEIPNGDGSSLPVMDTLLSAGIVELDKKKRYITVDHPIYYRKDDVTLSILPSEEFRVSMTIDYDHPAIGTQYASFTINEETFKNEIAPARTFCFLREVKMLQEAGLIQGGSLESAVLIGDDGILNETLHFQDEFVRHKILDLLGDTYLLGSPLKGHIIGVKCGHEKNVLFSKQIQKVFASTRPECELSAYRQQTRRQPAMLEVQKIGKVLPHRYPFLLVDKILSFDPLVSATGIKNVTVNEPFLQGHSPEIPVMPAVLIIEAMAQMGAVLIFGDNGEPNGQVAFLMGVENVRFKNTVLPGDQMLLKADMVHYRPNACKIRTTALVDDAVAAEAVMSFGLTQIE
ncbi:MAG TPA: bifunctional UDP-3-O-[3-hydroxymyristoyl] N-acetylglucosamine deacetylase/3-hydroxyacyl-ACP dehydratase [Candidatus Hydrogenedentes bacterium]|jgi:UDP-3-O-[3-hydroxymyristoyl] N-acetylglucosamine deacetylase/3-hydroxyacyl-[acyl-carrier-protein] dehydratase|nr:MAG: UDP-3-O-(3-hydroxymyristoyl) N-acetylglucosamine deacetylase [Candidatus Hydrogenedentes bacterium ADurb.Bin170]HNZ48211.1 bifunctional UDP-3-O-[3-hydroxymyristoyl] N-acetylglucosamine deacetylase/3-hydroxyacyl-ACP dehydratase [Candidatus Hydrogenedentota bacterium]HOM48607.1 bifunctional UDP-3-O-[3-hydroxymyristoyl] N-acetylglucosamine deacetylase/3-hydroxyacyl-ACP dehydratase [Candidatus Hydrogenedentota bacterium]HOR50696.1 bifunctional UDP-3-O-[3-hydroxymyristoyl] N-acetylglucosamine